MHLQWEQNQASSSEQVEQVRASYEYKLTMLQNRIAELENAAPRADPVEHKERLRMLEEVCPALRATRILQSRCSAT